MSENKPRPSGRPRSESATSHDAIMDAVYALLQERSVRDLTMEAVAKRAGVGKPTLYKWWPSKAALIFAMFHERLADQPEMPAAVSAEASLRTRIRRLIVALNGQFGKVMAELIAEGQSDPTLLHELHERHIRMRRAAAMADLERGKAEGEFTALLDAELALDAIVGAIYYRLLMRTAPLDEAYGEKLVDQALAGCKPLKD